MASKKADEKKTGEQGKQVKRVQADRGSVAIGGIGIGRDLHGEFNIAAGDIIKNVKIIRQRALTAAEEAARARKLESQLLAQGIANLVQNLSVQAGESTDIASPYKGLLPYSLNEAELFYGRNKAKKDLLDHLKQSPLTVLHAESGAGKSSLLQAGIAAQLISDGHLAVYLRPHGADPVDFIKRMFLPGLMQTLSLAKASLREFLKQVCAVLGSKITLYFLLDQFEEFFNLLEKNQRQPFLESLADCLNDPGLKVRWILALRADGLSDIDELESFGITPFKNMYRLNRLSKFEAREAIIEPAKQFGIQFEPGLIEHILRTLTTNDEVMPTHLQLVCSALTDELPEDKTLTLAYYTKQEGGTEGILRDYLKRQLNHLPQEEQALAWKILRALLTADRQRAVRTYREIINELKNSVVSNKQIETILARLVERRLLITAPATVATFELAHDYLIKEIELDPQEQARKAAQELLDQETRAYHRHRTLLSADRVTLIQRHQHELRFSEEAESLFSESQSALLASKRRRSWTLIILGTLAVIVSINMTILALHANREARISGAGELAFQSLALREKNFRASLLLSIEAFRKIDMLRTRGSLLEVAQANPQLLQFLIGDAGPIFSVAFSPDGTILASGSFDGTIILWDIDTHQRIGEPLRGHSGPVMSVFFSPDGTTLASGSADGTIILWDVDTQQRIGARLKGHNDMVTSVAFNSDGTTLASGSADSSIILWDVNTHQRIGAPLVGDAFSVQSVAFSPDGTTLASGSFSGDIILWDVNTHQPIGEPLHVETLLDGMVGPDNTVIYTTPHLVSFSPDGTILVSVSQDNSIILWDVDSHKRISEPLKGHNENVQSVVFSPDGTILASGSFDGTIILWDVDSHQRIGEPLRGHSGPVMSVFFSPDGTTLASGSADGTIILWDIDMHTHQQIGVPLKGDAGSVQGIAFSSDGTKLASGSYDGTIILWDVDTQKQIGQPIEREADLVFSVAFSPDGTTLASGSAQGTILWDVNTLQQIGQPLQEVYVLSVGFSPDGTKLASSDLNGTITLWNVKTHLQVGVPLKGDALTYSVAFSPDGKTLAAGSCSEPILDINPCRRGAIILWDVETHQPIGRALTGHASFVTSVAFSPDGTTLASGSADGTVIIWDVDSHKQIGEPLNGMTGYVRSVAFSPDGTMLASGSDHSTIILWDVDTHQQIGEPLQGHSDVVMSIAFSLDGTKLASGSLDNTIVLWDMGADSWIKQSCQRAGGNFTSGEWEHYFPNEQYRKTCEQ